jgi:hypothetical protein
MATPFDTTTHNTYRSTERHSCAMETCFATFEAGAADVDEVRHCNRAGPDGGHAHRWNGQQWQVMDGRTEHDRS